MVVPTESRNGWAITALSFDKTHRYFITEPYRTRQEAIKSHCDLYGMNWAVSRRHGFRAVRVETRTIDRQLSFSRSKPIEPAVGVLGHGHDLSKKARENVEEIRRSQLLWTSRGMRGLTVSSEG